MHTYFAIREGYYYDDMGNIIARTITIVITIRV